MPWPDFTELTFGFAFLREFEGLFVQGGSFPKAPDFISQGAEATKGYDVEIAMNDATPVFIQLKRSYVLTRGTAKEIKDGSFPAPRVYRMNLHKKARYRQHKALQRLENTGHQTYYVTSQIYTQPEFSNAFSRKNIVSDASALFSPNEIILPDDTKDHHVSFRKRDDFGYIYSSEPHRFERKFANPERWMPRLRDGRRSTHDNRSAMKRVANLLLEDMSLHNPLHQLIRDRKSEQQASILAYCLLDAHLIFIKCE